jgi:hypothetical protein
VLKDYYLVIQLLGLVFSYSGEQVYSLRIVLSAFFFRPIRSNTFYTLLMYNLTKDVLDSKA